MKWLPYLLIALLAVSITLNIVQCTRKTEQPSERIVKVVERDTIIETKISYDTVFFNRTKTEIQYDTIMRNDTVYIKDEPHDYRVDTTDYTLDINAVKLNWYKLDIHTRDTVTLTRTEIIENTIVKKKNRLGFGVFAGPSYDFINRKMGVSVGCGITFDLTK